MNPEISHRVNQEEEEKVNLVEEALMESGLSSIKAPKPGTPVYQRLIEAARGYMNEVRKAEIVSAPESIKLGYSDREDYYRPKKPSPASSSDTVRREYHDKLSIMLFGKTRKELTKFEAGQVSNFAANITGDENYIDSWG